MERRLKFYGWGVENTGLDGAEREQLFRFRTNHLGIEPSLVAPPQMADIGLYQPPSAIAHLLSVDPYERLLHTYGKSSPLVSAGDLLIQGVQGRKQKRA